MTCIIQSAWLLSPHPDNSAILHSSLFLPFAFAWAFQFAHTVGRIILAHITKSEFPVWDNMWLWSIIGAVDSHLPQLIGRYAYLYMNEKSNY